MNLQVTNLLATLFNGIFLTQGKSAKWNKLSLYFDIRQQNAETHPLICIVADISRVLVYLIDHATSVTDFL